MAESVLAVLEEREDRALMRPPDTVMRLARLGAFHQTRLSFLRAMLRHVASAGYDFAYDRWEIGADGVGVAVLTARGNGQVYSLVCFAHNLDPALRTDRVIAEAWDATYVLYDGVPDDAEIERLRANAPKQEAGRYLHSDLILSRTNKSARLFAYVVECLAMGEQPDSARLEDVGYAMRTTAVYGNGKFGIADRARYAERDGWGGPFRLEMLTVWLIRQFVADLVDHMARVKGGDAAVPLERALRRRLGVGNSTGLGLGPFIVNHPALFAIWIEQREQALADVCEIEIASETSQAVFLEWLARAAADVAGWDVTDEQQAEKIELLKADIRALQGFLGDFDWAAVRPWLQIRDWSTLNLSLEGQELAVSLILEPHGELVDDYAEDMAYINYRPRQFLGDWTAGELMHLIDSRCDWALSVDYTQPENSARFWYVSANKLEPRLGERWEEAGSDLELPLAVGRDIALCHADLKTANPAESAASFLRHYPEHRHVVRRLSEIAFENYGLIQDNLIGADLLPLDLLRCKLSFFGATRFDPKSDRWLRINMFRNAPYPDEITDMPADDWIYPAVGV